MIFTIAKSGASMLSFGSNSAAYGTVFSGVPYAVAAAYKSRPGLRFHAASRTLLHVSPRLGIWWGTCMGLFPLGTYAVDRLGLGSKSEFENSHPLANRVLPTIFPLALSLATLGRLSPPGQSIAFSVSCALVYFMTARGRCRLVGDAGLVGSDLS